MKAVTTSLSAFLLLAPLHCGLTAEASLACLAKAEPAALPSGLRLSALDWFADDGKEVRVLFRGRKTPPTMLVRRLDADLQDKGDVELLPRG